MQSMENHEGYAVIELSGKQFRIKPGDIIVVESAIGQEGQQIVVDRVLAAGPGSDMKVGSPYIEGAQVVAEVLEIGKTRKIRSFKYKRRSKSTRRRLGHRQDMTRLLIKEIKGV